MSQADEDTRESRKPFAARLRYHILAIATGEGIARLCNLLLVIFISRTFGVRAAGAYAVAQALSVYQMHGIDFGLRQTGARLAARHPQRIGQVVRFVQRRRIALAVSVVALGYLYGRAGPVQEDARSIVSLYAISIFGYGLSVDWLAWGMQRFALMSGWRALVSAIGLAVTVTCVVKLHAGLLIVPLAIGLAYLIAGSWLWICWARKVVGRDPADASDLQSSEFPDWKSIAVLGTALLMYQAFYSIDTMMLGGMTDSMQTGLYSTAYRLLLLVLAVYYFVMQAVYPRLAAIPRGQRRVHPLRRPLLLAAASGMAIASLMWMVRTQLIGLLFGQAFVASAALATPLLIAIPLDFVTSVLLTILIAWDHPRRVIAATGIAVATNVVLNLFLIPRFGAMGAAYSTPLSYAPFLLVLVWQLRTVSRREAMPGDANEAISSPLVT
ncbi:MAG: polysaccharide biosynthesis C-terminal domain-containing protein [Silvibacterium sp.]|nr:polysaccharide biosynthesis C-terminal domain-containing protein [Silvibacterium sp.]